MIWGGRVAEELPPNSFKNKQDGCHCSNTLGRASSKKGPAEGTSVPRSGTPPRVEYRRAVEEIPLHSKGFDGSSCCTRAGNSSRDWTESGTFSPAPSVHYPKLLMPLEQLCWPGQHCLHAWGIKGNSFNNGDESYQCHLQETRVTGRNLGCRTHNHFYWHPTGQGQSRPKFKMLQNLSYGYAN